MIRIVSIAAVACALTLGDIGRCPGADPDPPNAVGSSLRGTVIVVRPKGWQGALQEWIDYRKGEARVIEIDSRPNAHEQRLAILAAAAGCSPPAMAVMLCGDVAKIETVGNRRTVLALTPAMVLDTSVRLGEGTTDELCTDALFGDLDDDGCPDLAVGRIPAKSPEELKRMLHRSLVYEAAAPGPWNDALHVTAGVGGFGVLADTAIETVTRRFLTEGVPDHFHLNMTYASCTSTYCPSPLRLRESYIDRINQGGLFWVYIGHGAVTELDYMLAGNEWLPIGNADDAGRFRIHSRPPIALLLACFTGAYDANVDCFAERLLAQESGPIAVIAGSRVTMPYGLSQLASELINGCFRDRIPTLGEVVLEAKRRIWADDEYSLNLSGKEAAGVLGEATASSSVRVDIRKRYRKIVTDMAMALSPGNHALLEERREHVRLMNLLGDPLLKIPYPDVLPMTVPSKAEPGTRLRVTGKSPIAGRLHVELSLVRDRLPEGVMPIAAYDGRIAQQDQMQSTYESSNQLVLSRFEQDIAPGEFQIELDVPVDVKGRCVISAYVYGERTWAVASERIVIRKPK